MATPIIPPLLGSPPSALTNGTIPALAPADFWVIERAADGKVFNALVSQFDTRYTTVAQNEIASAIGVSVQAYSANLDAWAAVVPGDYLTIAAGDAAYQPLNTYLSQFAGLTPGPATDGYVPAWDDTASAYELVAQSGGGASLPVVDETAIIYKTGNEAITATFDANSLTAARTYTLPNVSTALAGLAEPNTFTVAQVVNVNSIEAFKVEKSSNNTLVVDTTNGRVGINTAPSRRLHIRDTANTNVDALFSHPDGANQDINFYMGIIPTGSNAFDFSGPAGYYGMSGFHPFVFATSNETRLKIQGGGNVEVRKKLSVQDNVMIGDYSVATTAAKLHIDQSSTTGTIPVLLLDQADLSEEFIRFTSTVGAGNPIDTAALGAYYGKVRVYVAGVGAKWLALYD